MLRTNRSWHHYSCHLNHHHHDNDNEHGNDDKEEEEDEEGNDGDRGSRRVSVSSLRYYGMFIFSTFLDILLIFFTD